MEHELSLANYSMEDLVEGRVTNSGGSNPFFNLAGKSALVVEDSTDTFDFIRRFLELANMDVHHALNGEDALEKASIYQPDVILMDLFMPVMDGYEATKILRARGYSKPIIAVSAHEEDRSKCIGLEFDDLITKPINRVRLLYVVSIQMMCREEH